MNTSHAVDREEVMALLDGELPSARAAAVNAHLQTCAECLALVSSLRRVSSDLSRWQIDTAPPNLRLPEVAVRVGSPTKRDARRWFGIPRWVVVAAPVAAMAVVVVLQWPARRSIQGGRTVTSFASTPSPSPGTGNQGREAAAYGGGGSGRVGGMPSADRNQAQQAPSLDYAQGQAQGAAASSGPMIVRAVSRSIVTERFTDARTAVERVVADVRGMIGSMSVRGATPEPRSLNATLRVPADRLDGVLIELRRLGQTRQETQTSNDIVDAHRDLVVRIENAKKEEARLNELLTRQTTRLQDVLAVEKEITRVRGEIERMVAEEMTMRSRVSYATIVVDIAEAYRAEVTLGDASVRTRLRNAIVEGWRTAINGLLDVVLFVLQIGPSLVIGIAVLGIPAIWYWRRRQAHTRAE
jgi:anti-sigma factor RsiW